MCSTLRQNPKKVWTTSIINHKQNWVELESGLILDLFVLMKIVQRNKKNPNPWRINLFCDATNQQKHGFIYRYIMTILSYWYLYKFISERKQLQNQRMKEDSTRNGLSWSKLPTLVSIKIFSLLSYSRRKVSRLVCSDWKLTIDELIGVSLLLDEYRDCDEGYLDFIQSLKLRKVSIGNIIQMMNKFNFKHPRSLQTVTCQGTIHKDWFCSTLLRRCTNLNKLILKGEFLARMISIPPLNNDDDSSSSNNGKIICPNLQTLEIISPRSTVFPRHFAMSYYLNVFHDPVNHPNHNTHTNNLSPRNNEDCIQQTMAMILNTIYSPRLELLHIFVYENFFINKAHNYWKESPCENFLQAHHSTLKELYLPEFRGKRSNESNPLLTPLDRDNSYKKKIIPPPLPTELTSLEICIHRYHHVGGLGTEQNHDFFKHLIKSQTKLRELTMELHKMRTEWTMDVLQCVLDQSRWTLTILKMQIVRADEDDCILSGHLFRELTCLEELRLEGDALTNHVLTLTDFQELPKSLKKILTMFLKIDQSDFSCIHQFRRLKYIELNRIVLPSPPNYLDLNEEFGHDHPSPTQLYYSSIFTKILQQLLCHRSLDHLGLCLSKSVTSCEHLRDLMENFATSPRNLIKRPGYMPNYYGIVVAHQYEIDDKFDLYRPTNRENIFVDDLMVYIRPKKGTDKISLVEVKVEVERRETRDFYEDFYEEDHVSDDSDDSSGMPSLHSIDSDSDLEEMEEDEEDQHQNDIYECQVGGGNEHHHYDSDCDEEMPQLVQIHGGERPENGNDEL